MNTNSAFGAVVNPWPNSNSERRSAGGSSGGSAAAVAADLCTVFVKEGTFMQYF